MCKYCEGYEPLISTGCLNGHNITVSIWKNTLVAESSCEDAYGKETVNKGVKIKFCPYCGDGIEGIKGAE